MFLCLDVGPAKRAIVDRLDANGQSYIEVGMGVLFTDDNQLAGIVRVTTSTPETSSKAAPHISFADGDSEANEYSTNIQIADLNALSAALAVIRWKRLKGIYRDGRGDYYSGYSLATGDIVVEGMI